MDNNFPYNFFNEDMFILDLVEINNILNQSSNVEKEFDNCDLINSLYKEHSWQNLIFSTNPIRVDNETLSNNPDSCLDIAKSIKYYNQKLDELIKIRIKEGKNYNQEKWNYALDKLKTLLYSEIKSIIEQIQNVDLPDELKDYIDSCIVNDTPIQKEILKQYCNISTNLLNNYINNRSRRFKKEKLRLKINNQ